MSQEGVPETAVTWGWETSLRPNNTWTSSLRGEEGKPPRTPKADREYQHISPSSVARKPQKLHKTGFQCLPAAPCLLSPANVSMQLLGRGNTNSPGKRTESCRNPTHSPKNCSWRRQQHPQNAEFWGATAGSIWGSWKASPLQARAQNWSLQ